jgi:[acyl-carrier-protein] S-malonyltransferase
MDKQTFKWWISSHSQLEKELRTWKMYCQSLASEVDNMARKVETMQKMAAMNIAQVAECGPGKVLAGLTKRINEHVIGLPIFDEVSLNEALAAVK